MTDTVIIVGGLFVLGAFIGVCRAMATGEHTKPTVLFGKAGISAATSLVAGMLSLTFADAPLWAVGGAGAALALLGPEVVRSMFDRLVR